MPRMPKMLVPKTGKHLQKFRESYLRHLTSFKLKYDKYPEFIKDFTSIPAEPQLEMLRVESCFSGEYFIAYFSLMKAAGFPKTSVMQAVDSGYRSLYKKIGRNVELQCPITEMDSAIIREIMEGFRLGRRQFGSARGEITVIYMLRALYGEEVLIDFISRARNEADEVTVLDLVNVLPHWTEIKEYPLSWGVKLYSTSTV